MRWKYLSIFIALPLLCISSGSADQTPFAPFDAQSIAKKPTTVVAKDDKSSPSTSTKNKQKDPDEWPPAPLYKWVKPDFRQNHSGFITGDYLFWQAREEGLTYAAELTPNPNSAPPGSTFVPQLFAPNFEWDSGFRVGAGYRMAHDKWEMGVNWTHFITTATSHRGPTPNFLFSVWTDYLNNFDINPLTAVKSRWDLHLNLADGEFARYVLVTEYLSLRPHFGVRAAWINQSYRIEVNGGQLDGFNVLDDVVKLKCDFRGVGIKGGLDTEWMFDRHWSLFGNLDGSLLYGRFHTRRRDDILSGEFPTVRTLINSSLFSHQILPTVDFAAGVRFDYTFSHRWALRLQAGWEFNIFFEQNQLWLFSTQSVQLNPGRPNLTTQGLVISGRVDF